MMGLLIVPFQGAAQSRWELYFRTGLGWGEKKLLLRVEPCHFFFNQYYYESYVPCISRMDSEKPNHAAIQKRGGEFSPGQGDARDPAGRGKLLLKIRIRK